MTSEVDETLTQRIVKAHWDDHYAILPRCEKSAEFSDSAPTFLGADGVRAQVGDANL